MARRISWCMVLFAVVGVPYLAKADDAKPVEPTLVVQIKSLDGLLNDVKYLMQLVNQGDMADQIDGVIGAWAGPQGLAGSGIDVKRPFLVYVLAKSGGIDSPFAVMVPINNSDTFLKLLESLSVPVTKADDGCHTVEIPGRPVPLYFRFANDYVYITAMDKANIDTKALVAPDKLKSNDPTTVIGVTLRIDQIPETMKQLILGQMELRMADVKERKLPGESAQQARVRKEGVDALALATKTILNEGKSLQLNWTIDRDKHDIGVALAMDGKPNSMMASVIGALSGGPSRFAPAKDAAFHIGLNFAVPEFIRPFVGGLIELGSADIVARESDPARRDINTKLLNAVAPTLKGGVLDLHIVAGAKGTGGRFNVCAALGVENGQAIEAAVKDFIRTIPADQQSRIKLDANKVGDVNLHQIKVDGFDEQAKRLFGENANVWTGFGKSAMMLGVGADAGDVFNAVQGKGEKVASPLLVIEGSLGALAATSPDQKASEVAKEVFSKAPAGADRFRLSLEGGQQLKLKFSFKGQALKFAAEMNEKQNR